MRWCYLLLSLLSFSVVAEDLLPEFSQVKNQDFIYGQALFSLHSGDYDKALSLNSKLKKRKKSGYGKVLDIQEATAQLGLGISQSAKNNFRTLIADKRVSVISSGARAQSWFYLSKHFYTKGMWKTALSAIRKVDSLSIKTSLKDEYHFLASTLELFVGNKSKADKHILSIDNRSKWSTYAFLNLAVSYTERDIHISKVEAVFNKALLQVSNTENPEELADKIHLMAGEFFFSSGRGRSAISHLKSVGLDSAFTPKALLTYGWALTEQWQYHDALQPWYMLKTAHSPLNQDVQETLIAIPYLLEKLNAKVMALGAFDYASDQYDIVYKKLEKSALRLNTGKFIEPLLAQQIPDRWGAFEKVDLSLPKHPDQVYLKEIMSKGYFQGQLKTLRDLHVIRYKMNDSIRQLDAFSQVASDRRSEYLEIKTSNLVVNQSKKLKNLKARFSKLNRKILKAFGNANGHGLASEEENQYLAGINSVKQRISRLKNKKELKPKYYIQRLARAEGVLKWTLSERYLDRKKQVSASLTELRRSIKDTSQQLDAAKFAYRVAPKTFSGFENKIVRLKANYLSELKDIDLVYHAQREKVGSYVKFDIKKRQERVMDYQLQSRLAAARLFDETSNQTRVIARSGEL